MEENKFKFKEKFKGKENDEIVEREYQVEAIISGMDIDGSIDNRLFAERGIKSMIEDNINDNYCFFEEYGNYNNHFEFEIKENVWVSLDFYLI